MRKQTSPTEITNQAFGGFFHQPYGMPEAQPQGYYDANPQPYNAPPPSLLAGPKANAGFSGQKQEAKQGGIQLVATPTKGGPEKPKEAAAVASSKHAVESESTYPTPHKSSSLLGIFFTDPGKFEGTLYLSRLRGRQDRKHGGETVA